MENLVQYLAEQLVDHPEDVKTNRVEDVYKRQHYGRYLFGRRYGAGPPVYPAVPRP